MPMHFLGSLTEPQEGVMEFIHGPSRKYFSRHTY
jgi:hypothetical protein